MLKAIGHMLAYNTIAALEDDLSDEYKKEFILTQELQAEKATVAAAKTVSELQALGLEELEQGTGGFDESQDLADKLNSFNDEYSAFSDGGKVERAKDGAT